MDRVEDTQKARLQHFGGTERAFLCFAVWVSFLFQGLLFILSQASELPVNT